MSTVEEWKAALEEVAYLAGINLQKRADGFRQDLRCIQVIVEQVGETLIRTTFDVGLRQVANLPGGYFQSRTERKRTRNGEGTSSDLISLETLQQHFGSKRKDVADSFGISVSTLKRVCRSRGIPRWPHTKRKNVSRHSDPHRQENPSPTFNTPSTNGHITMENEMGGPNSEPTVYNETTTAAGSSQCVFRLQGHTTQSTAYPNHNALLFPQPQIASTEVLNESIGGSEYRRDLLASRAEAYFEGHVSESSNLTFHACYDAATPRQALASVATIPNMISHLVEGSPNTNTFQLENEMGGLILEPNEFLPDSFEVPSFGNTLNDLLAEMDFDGSFPVSRHSDPHQQENPSPTFNTPSTNGQITMENEMDGPSLEPTVYNETTTAGSSSQCVFQLEGQTMQSTAYPHRNALLFPQTQIASTEVVNENIGGSEYGRDLLASQAEAYTATPSQALASVPTIPHMISHLVEGSPKTFQLENEMGGLILEPNEFLPDFFEAPSFGNTLGDLLVEMDFDGSFPGNYRDADFSFSSVNNETEAAGGSYTWAFQVQGQTTQFPAYPISNVVALPPPQIASTEVLSENMGSSKDRINFLASQGEAFLEGHVFESSNLMVPAACSDAAGPSQPEATILHMMPTIPQGIPHLTGRSSEWAFQSPEFPAYPNPNDLVDPHPQTASTQIPSEIMGSLEDQSNLLAPQEEPLIEGHVFGSVNGTVHSSSETALSQQPVATIPGATPTISDQTPSISMMPHLAAREDTRSVMLKLTYGQKKIRFPFPLMSGIIELKEQVKKRLKKLDLDSFDVEYEDATGDRILLGCDEDLRDHLQLSNNQEVRLLVVDAADH
ncbi:hypothetical protein Vadar_009954 [Vaccinium darrowii]|uniref:Uncharacterized protein n=1 Tax=Vaccinium darrowii TaxID=229202 RepID=A0ACB7Z4A4_9ERIC|nr:hypothetical protein Vadar_009954 [Vaccinium darrowii]